jgi:phage tail protein X
VIARGDQQLVKRRPVISPIEIEADALAKLGFFNVAAPPLVENVLVAGKNRFNPEDHWAISGQRTLLDQRCGMPLCCRKRMIIADQHDIRGMQRAAQLLGIEHAVITAKTLVEFAKIFPAAVRILQPDLALHSRQRLQLRRGATGPEIGSRCHVSS